MISRRATQRLDMSSPWQRWAARLMAADRIALSFLYRASDAAPVTVPFDSGQSRVFADLETPLGLQLYRYGLWNDDLERLSSCLAQGDAFIDCGAHIGLFSLVAASRVGASGSVYAYEPSPETAKRLRSNLRLNGFSHVHAHQVALDGHTGMEEFFVFNHSSAGLNSFEPPDGFHGRTINVTTTTLDEILAANPDLREKLALVKLDCEGAEARILSGADYALREIRCPFMVEIEPQHLRRQGSSSEDIYRIFQEVDYQCIYTSDSQNAWFIPNK